MAETFRCPSCSAPLKFQGKMVQTCNFCANDVIAPAELFKSKDDFQDARVSLETGQEDFEKKEIQTEAEMLRDASGLGQKALKIAEIKRAVKDNRKLAAAILFRENFGGGLADAKEIVDALEKEEKDGAPGVKPKKSRSSATRWMIVLVAALAAFLALFLIFSENRII